MSIDLTGIQNIGEFYSHHYLDALLENDLKGLFARWREDDETTPDRRLYRLGTEYFRAKSLARPELSLESRFEPSHRLHVALLEALGYAYSFELRYLEGKFAIPVLSALLRDGHAYLWIVETPFPGRDELMEADTSPFDQPLFRRQYPPAAAWGEGDYSLPEGRWEDLIGDIFHSAEPPRWLLLCAGRYVYLVDRTKWGRGQYLLFDLDEIMGRRQPQTLRAVAALLSKDALCPDEGVPIHDTLDENSHKHAYGVSSDLKYGVRRAVELIGNEYVWYQRSVAKQALFQDEDLARRLTDEALSYLYRLLFLLYAEARGAELEVVPMKAEAYLKGYSLEALRDLEQAPLTTPQAQNGYYLNDSLNRLFSLVDEGYRPTQLALLSEDSQPLAGDLPGYDDYSFRMDGLHSPLFNRASTPLLSSVRLRNFVLQEIIQLLSLSRPKRGKKSQRGRISYAQLGINQLGAVYEALLSYSGFFANERLYEVKPADAKDADETAQTYFIPEGELERYLPEEFVYDGETGQRKRYEKGTFIFRLAGRDREKSASYYTPEVLTQCVVKYSLKELLKEKTADDILNLRLCEPAMGSGAFINEALNQLADAYLERKQKETEQKISPEAYRSERQKVKYFLATHNAYGVDLNPTAVRLAEVSLWLNILHPGAPTPWFGGRLAAGNSLIGARRQGYTVEDVKSGKYKEKAPGPHPPAPSPNPGGRGAEKPLSQGWGEGDFIFHWLLPDAGMAAFDNDKVIKELAAAEVEAIKKWRKEFTKPFSAAEIKNLLILSERADALWRKALDERLLFLETTRQPVQVWGQPENSRQQSKISIEQAEKELAKLQRPASPYARLKLALDYWCALWFWPIPEATKLPTRAQYLDDLAAIFAAGEEAGFERPAEQLTLFEPAQAKQAHFGEMEALTITDLCIANPRLALAQQVAEGQRFHHWELVFPEVFTKNNGFDLILGNPPWMQVRWEQLGVLTDMDPYIGVKGFDTNSAESERESLLAIPANQPLYINEFTKQTGIKRILATKMVSSVIGRLHPNLYTVFIITAWSLGSQDGVVGFLHDQGLYSSTEGGSFRQHIYRRLKNYFHFHNELRLFDIDHTKKFEISVFKAQPEPEINFIMVVNLFHPCTIDYSWSHDGLGKIPSIKDEHNNWEIRGHSHRLISITSDELKAICKLYEEPKTPYDLSRLPQIHSKQVMSVIQKLVDSNNKFRDLRREVFYGFILHETDSLRQGKTISHLARPKNISHWIISAPQISVANPFFQEAKEDYSNRQDYQLVDLTEMPDTFLPRSVYQASDTFIKSLLSEHGEDELSKYRLINREMALTTFERTLITTIIPPYVAHINTCWSNTFPNNRNLCIAAAFTSSLILDFIIKTIGNLHLRTSLLDILPVNLKPSDEIVFRIVRLNCLTTHYAALWEELYTPAFNQDGWSQSDPRLKAWGDLTPHWQRHVALRTPFERRQALVEIDVLAALALGLALEELLTIYRVQFPVLQKNERRLLFDQRGMEVPVKTVGGELGVDESHPKFGEMVPPFTPVDREDDYRAAWKWFEGKLQSEGKNTPTTGQE